MQQIEVREVPILRLVLLSIVLASIISCAEGDPAMPSLTGTAAVTGQTVETSNHILWGIWEGYIPASHDSLEFRPARSADIHLNARRLLEDTQCSDCIRVLNVQPDPAGGILRADVEIRHPWPGLDRYTGFDVRAVVITNGSLYFPAMNATVPSAKAGDFTLVNPDGYTRLWNTLEFPPGSGPFPILEYSRGSFAYPGDFTATVNPFVKYSVEPRDHFPAGESITRTMEFNLPSGPLRFGYAVDASWMPPTVEPVTDIWSDFPPSANAQEPSITSVFQQEVLTSNLGDTDFVRVKAIERQNPWVWVIMFDGFELEVPALSDDIFVMTGGYSFAERYLENPISTSMRITNYRGIEPGEYPALFRIRDPIRDPWLGDINHAYMLFDVIVSEPVESKVSGLLVYKAPLENIDPPQTGAMNVILVDLEDGSRTIVSDYVGDGMLLGEPRINPTGTHILWDAGATPLFNSIFVHEIGGGTVCVTPSASCDGSADFHPDGEHIIVASGTQIDQIYDLYMEKYDGSERTFIATAPYPIRNPRCSPDGNRIVMTLVDDPPETDLYLCDILSGEFTELAPAEGFDENPSWSPVEIDGAYLVAFDSNRDYPEDPLRFAIKTVNPDTGEIIFDSWDSGERHPSFSPDGQWLAFYSDIHWEITLYSFETEKDTVITWNDWEDMSPSWCWGW